MSVASAEQVRPGSDGWVLGGLSAFAFASLGGFALQAVGLASALLFGFQGLGDEIGASDLTFDRARVALFTDALPLLLASLAFAVICLVVIHRRFGLRSILEDRALVRAAILLIPAFFISSMLSFGVGYLWHM